METAPTRFEIEKIFLKRAEDAWETADRIKRDEVYAMGAAGKTEADRQAFLEMIRLGGRPGEYIRVEPLPPSGLVRGAQARSLIDPSIPVFNLQVKRRGGEINVEGEFFFVGTRWVMVPFVSRVFPELK
jgi:hypothetical protein